VATKSPNENRLLIAFSIEKNSGIDGGDLAEPTMFVVLADRAGFRVSKLGRSELGRCC
jgi:hypothetical protein